MKLLKPNEMNKSRSQRLRKKLRVGEFREFGVHIELTFDHSNLDFEQAIDLLLDHVEMQHWVFGGGGELTSNKIAGFICQSERGSLTDTQVDGLKVWLQKASWITKFSVSELIDAWHADSSEMDARNYIVIC